ncbi:hypothetical protein BJ741DRAFT_582836 [Chytriomyces cf. hyalinus JEL632]|nr:hypothetical protein BJ741DRAFT_582836 [Chytriomyces cf. hyalinus JEL632]
MPIHYLNGACPIRLRIFKAKTARYRRELNTRRPSSVATVPEYPHRVQIRPEIKKGDNPYAPYIPSQLSRAERAENPVVDYEIVKRHLESQQKWHDLRVKSKKIVRYCHRVGVCTKKQDRLYTVSMIKLKWRGVAFKLDENWQFMETSAHPFQFPPFLAGNIPFISPLPSPHPHRSHIRRSFAAVAWISFGDLAGQQFGGEIRNLRLNSAEEHLHPMDEVPL